MHTGLQMIYRGMKKYLAEVINNSLIMLDSLIH